MVLDDGRVVREAKRKTPVRGGPMGVVDASADVVGQLGGPDGVPAVGIGAPGAVDAKGVVQRAPNLPGWDEPFALVDAMSECLDGLPVAVDNDVNVGTLAELRLGSAQGSADALGIFVGTGVGGAVVLDGKLRRGPTGVAGELGHVVVRQGARKCGCGRRGHLEAYAGRWGMEQRARRLAWGRPSWPASTRRPATSCSSRTPPFGSSPPASATRVAPWAPPWWRRSRRPAVGGRGPMVNLRP